MNSVIGQIISCGSYVSKRDGKNIYTVRLLCENKVVVMFYNDKELFDKFEKLERLTDIQILGDLRIKDENSFSFVPKSFEI